MSEAGATKVREALNRGLDFFGTAVLALLATSIVHGFRISPTWWARLDDLALGLVTVLATAWYLTGRNRYRCSLAPLGFLLLGVPAKIAGMWLPHGRLVLAGPDFGIAVFLALAAVIFGWQFAALHEPAGEARAR